ncbi:hypothetical protein MRX96_040018 [Rhipicephalus microplus]
MLISARHTGLPRAARFACVLENMGITDASTYDVKQLAELVRDDRYARVTLGGRKRPLREEKAVVAVFVDDVLCRALGVAWLGAVVGAVRRRSTASAAEEGAFVRRFVAIGRPFLGGCDSSCIRASLSSAPSALCLRVFLLPAPVQGETSLGDAS